VPPAPRLSEVPQDVVLLSGVPPLGFEPRIRGLKVRCIRPAVLRRRAAAGEPATLVVRLGVLQSRNDLIELFIGDICECQEPGEFEAVRDRERPVAVILGFRSSGFDPSSDLGRCFPADLRSDPVAFYFGGECW
jgi:hypothetical protein